MDRGRRAAAAGGGGALAAAALSLALVVLVAASRTAPGAAPLALAAGRLGFAGGVALAVVGLAAELRPPSVVGTVGAGCGLLAAAMLAVSAAGGPLATTAPAGWPTWTGYWAPVPLGVWLLCAAAVAWKLGRLPRWLRVVAALDGAVLFMQPAIPELGAVTLVVGLVWWTGLGIALLRAARGDSPPPAAIP